MKAKAFVRAIALSSLIFTAGSAIADDEPLPMRTEAPLVYETPLKNTVILEFKLYDNETWCLLYIRKDAWEAAKQNGGLLPENFDEGQLQCERR